MPPKIDDKPFIPSGAPNALPAGEAFKADSTSLYRLKATWKKNGNPVTGYAYPVGANAATSFWDYVVFGEGAAGKAALKFYLSPPDADGWCRWNIQDDDSNSGYHLDCKATGWLYRASLYDTKFRIVDRHLYCSYWGGAAGSEFNSFLVSAGEYLGMGNLPKFTCELEMVTA
ncbi:MAG TPA: hypothetical protein VFP71_11325 [Candidatus Angelobacter sp.]|nr:hypothetical protein [Candidatus Angelobacter sp.]